MTIDLGTEKYSILEEAQTLIHGDRNKNYGHPRENFRDIAALFGAYFGIEVTDLDVANLMILVKVARVKGTGYHRDSFTDIAGYAGCAERIYEEPEEVPEDDQFFVSFINQPVQPRVFYHLGASGCPPDVNLATDRNGDVWSRGLKDWYRTRDGKAASSVYLSDTTPFTEVLEDK